MEVFTGAQVRPEPSRANGPVTISRDVAGSFPMAVLVVPGLERTITAIATFARSGAPKMPAVETVGDAMTSER